MSTTKRRPPEPMEYDLNRVKFTMEQLAPYDQKWVAFSIDGKRIVAADPDLLELDKKVVAAGENPENVGLEFIDSRAIKLGGIELFG
jgi:hypothetical protein